MLTHGRDSSKQTARAVVLGAGGFIGGAVARRIAASGTPTVGLARKDVDLLAPGAARELAGRLQAGDALVLVSARAPCKDAFMLVENLQMAGAVCEAIQKVPVSHLVYVSSDAVYKDSDVPLTEESCAEPASIHGVMHLAREVALRASFSGPFAIIRPTLVYGLDDPHNGYGPNRFRRLAAGNRAIDLFGDGEERRDHVSVEDVAEIVARTVLSRSTGILNAVSGEVASFWEIAKYTAAQFPTRVEIRTLARQGPMPHKGYRPFDSSAIAAAFPDFRITAWKDGVAAVCRQARIKPT
jgi:UDP-glucose 4-epimerase